MATRLFVLLSLAVSVDAHGSDPDDFPVEGFPAVATEAEEEPAAPPSAVEAPAAPAPAEVSEVAPAPAAAEVPEVAPPPVPEEAPRKGFVPWVGKAARDVGAALGAAWRGVTGKRKAAPATAIIEPELAPAAPVPAIVAPEPAPAAPPADECEEAPPRWRFHQHTLFGVKRRSGRFGLHVGGTGLLSEYDSGRVGAWGLEGGMVLGSHGVLGAAAYGTGPFEAFDHDVRFAYAGFQPGLLLWSGALVHPRFDVLLGTGAVFEEGSGRLLAMAPVVVPRLGAELNVSRALRLAGNVGWRFVGAPGESGDAFSGLEAGVTVRFGWM